MKLIVEHRGRADEVVVDRQGEVWLVRVGETDYRVDAATVASTARSLRVAGGQYEVDVAHLGDGRYEVSRSGWVGAAGAGPAGLPRGPGPQRGCG